MYGSVRQWIFDHATGPTCHPSLVHCPCTSLLLALVIRHPTCGYVPTAVRLVNLGSHFAAPCIYLSMEWKQQIVIEKGEANTNGQTTGVSGYDLWHPFRLPRGREHSQLHNVDDRDHLTHTECRFHLYSVQYGDCASKAVCHISYGTALCLVQ